MKDGSYEQLFREQERHDKEHARWQRSMPTMREWMTEELGESEQEIVVDEAEIPVSRKEEST